MICYDIADNQIKQYNQTTSMWQALGSGGGTAKTWLAIPASIYTHSLTNLGPGYQETDWVTVDNAALDSHPSSFAILRIYCSAFGMAFLRPKGSTAASNWATLVHASDGNYKFTSMAIIPLDANGDFQVNFRALGFAGTQHLYIYLLGFFD
jgi:hypothetical protein